MKLIGSLIEHLQRWIARYGAALDYAEIRERRRPTPEIEWNGEMIGHLGAGRLTLRTSPRPQVRRDRHHPVSVRLTRLAIGADDLDARGRSPMCCQRTPPSLGGEAGGRSLGFISAPF